MNQRLWFISSSRHKNKKSKLTITKTKVSECAGSQKYQKADNYINFIYIEHVYHLVQDQSMFTNIHFRWASILRSSKGSGARVLRFNIWCHTCVSQTLFILSILCSSLLIFLVWNKHIHMGIVNPAHVCCKLNPYMFFTLHE